MTLPHKAIARWKLVAGAALHFLPLAYLAVLVIAAAMGDIGPGLAQALPQALRLGGRFLAGYGAVAGVATLLAALLDRIRPTSPPPQDAAEASRQALARALSQVQSSFGAEGQTLSGTLATLRLNHDDPAVQRLVGELALLVNTATTAIAAASDDGEAVRTASLPALRSLIGEIREAAHADAAAAQDAALVMAHYVRSKYDRGVL